MSGVTNKVVLVTGAASGLGLADAQVLFAILLGLQGISQSIKAWTILNNVSDDGSAPAWK